MKNPFCIRKKELIQIFFRGVATDKLGAMLKRFVNKYSLEEMVVQMET